MEMAKSKPTAATLVSLSVMPNLLKSKQPRCIWINGTIRVRRQPVRQPAGATEHTLFASHCQREVCAARRIAARNTGHLETSPSYRRPAVGENRKSTRLNSSHGYISYAVFCLKKKKREPIDWSHLRTARATRHTSAS